MTGRFTAVLDRIVDGETAVLLVESDGEIVAERTLPPSALPEEGRTEGAVFDVQFEDVPDEPVDGNAAALQETPIADLEYRPDESDRRRERAQDRFDRLSERLGEE